jgi:plasmid maintenance system antidote protein VapI
VESDLTRNKLTFIELTERLRAHIRRRINGGEYTERSLARVIRVSQPHLHNVLKGARRFRLEFADRLMAKFEISVLDLISQEELWNSCDEKDSDWLIQAAKRKPVAREDPRAPWKTGS